MSRGIVEIESAAADAAGRRPLSPAAIIQTRMSGVSAYQRGLIAITALALLARTALLGTVPRFWGDEAFNAVQVRKPLLPMLDVVRHDSHPPLIYLLQALIATVSTSPAALRLVSALAGTAAVLLSAAIGRRLAGDRAGLLAAAVLAAFPGYLLSSRDARGYALAMALVLAASLTLWRAIERPTRGRLMVYGACVAGSVYTHYFAIPAVGAQLMVALWAFWPGKQVAARLVIAAGVGGLTLVPWLAVATAQFQHAGSSFWVAPVHFDSLLADLWTRLGQTPGEELTTLGTLIGEAALVPLVVVLYRRVDPPRRPAVLYLLGCALVPTAVLLAVSLVKPVYDTRFVLIFWGPGEAVVGASLAVISWRWVAPAVCVGLVIASALSLSQIQRPDFEAVAAPLKAEVRPGDLVALNGADHYFSIAYAVDDATAGQMVIVADDIPWYFGTAGYPPGTQVHAIPNVPGRIYLVTDEGRRLPAIPSGFKLASSSCQGGVCVDAYAR